MGEHVSVDGVPQWKVKAKEASSTKASSLALKLMEVFFTKEELAQGNCTEAEGRELLSPDVINGIRCRFHFYYFFFIILTCMSIFLNHSAH